MRAASAGQGGVPATTVERRARGSKGARRGAVLTLAALAVATSACGSSPTSATGSTGTTATTAKATAKHTTGGGSATTTTSTTGSVPTATLSARLLALSDLPSGWQVTTTAAKSQFPSATCLAPLATLKPGGVSVSFGNTSGPGIGEWLGSGSSATSGWTAAEHAMATCPPFTATTHGVAIHGTISPLSLPTVGDRSTAFTMAVSLAGIDVTFDVVFFQVGAVDGMLGYTNKGTPSAATVTAFAKEAATKAAGKPVSPPQLAT